MQSQISQPIPSATHPDPDKENAGPRYWPVTEIDSIFPKWERTAARIWGIWISRGGRLCNARDLEKVSEENPVTV